jgi:hypothetical protein
MLHRLASVTFASVAASAIVLALIAFPSAQAGVQAGVPNAAAALGWKVRVLSNPRPDMVSGGDALIQVDVPVGVAARDLRMTLNDADITAKFRADPAGRTLTGLVTGLRDGSNSLAAMANGKPAARLTLVNHPNTGPVFAGPHEKPFICQTQDFKLRSGGTLGPALDVNCSIATRVDYLYRASAGGDLKPLADPKTLPGDVATVTTIAGQKAPYIVRVETGTINRAIYQIAMLHNPASEPAPDFMARPAGWNGRLIYTFGGGCVTGWYRQGASTGGVEDDVMLQRGYAVASASLNTFGNNCAELLAAETMMMVKEHFIEAYGAPTSTIGWGGSGGSYQQHQIADGYPGLLDGIMPARSFPDLAFGTVPFITDARLLKHYFDTLATMPYTDEQKRQVTGFGTLATMTAVYDDAGRINPMEHCSPVIPQELRYDPVKNPKGARCDVYDHAVNVYGRDPRTGFARRPLDNVGIQYGLAALNNGTITKAQFLELNERIGGFNNDGEMVPARSVGDPLAIRAAYRSGRLTNGGGGLATTPVIDYRAYLDDQPQGNVHVRYHSFSLRERLLKANGYADNHIMLTDDRKWGDSLRAPVLREALSQMDQWLTRLSEDISSDSKIAKLRRAKPADLVDACWTRDDKPQKIVEKAVYGSGRCESLYPANSFPRGVAGSPVAADVIKCQLRPINPADYKVSFTAEETARLKQIFAGGVCDWSKTGVEQQRLTGSWQTFNAPAGETVAAR